MSARSGCHGSLSERFYRKVALIPFHSCWEWTGRKNHEGYGSIYDGSSRALAHRVSWKLHHGPIPPGMCVLHACDNPSCVNPAHLFLGTQSDNVADMMAKDRLARKVSMQDAIDIRTRHSAGEDPSAIATRFGISGRYVRNIVRGECRKEAT